MTPVLARGGAIQIRSSQLECRARLSQHHGAKTGQLSQLAHFQRHKTTCLCEACSLSQLAFKAHLRRRIRTRSPAAATLREKGPMRLTNSHFRGNNLACLVRILVQNLPGLLNRMGSWYKSFPVYLPKAQSPVAATLRETGPMRTFK